jgi:hypothetical protein
MTIDRLPYSRPEEVTTVFLGLSLLSRVISLSILFSLASNTSISCFKVLFSDYRPRWMLLQLEWSAPCCRLSFSLEISF